MVAEERRENRRWIPVKIRKEVMTRDKGRCMFCGSEEKVGLSYRVPKCRGGLTLPFNLVAACKKCRQNKGHQLVEEFILSSYFQFEILKVGDPCEGKIMKIKVIFDDGDIIEGQVEEDPSTTKGDFYIRVGDNGGKILVIRDKVKYIEVSPTLSEKLK